MFWEWINPLNVIKSIVGTIKWLYNVDWPSVWRSFYKTWLPMILTLGATFVYEKSVKKKLTAAQIVARFVLAFVTVFFLQDYIEYYAPHEYEDGKPGPYTICVVLMTLFSEKFWGLLMMWVHTGEMPETIREIIQWLFFKKKS